MLAGAIVTGLAVGLFSLEAIIQVPDMPKLHLRMLAIDWLKLLFKSKQICLLDQCYGMGEVLL